MPSPETLLTPELSATICQLIKDGNRNEVAAEASGVSVRTYYRWMAKAEQGERPYVGFARSCHAARAHAEVDMMAAHLAGDPFKGSSTGTAAFNWLKTSRSKHYAEETRITVEVESVIDGFLVILERLLSTDQYVEVLTAWQDQRDNGAASQLQASEAPGHVKRKLFRAADVVDTEGEPTL